MDIFDFFGILQFFRFPQDNLFLCRLLHLQILWLLTNSLNKMVIRIVLLYWNSYKKAL